MSSRYGLQIRAPGSADAAGLAELFIAAGLRPDAAALSAGIEILARYPGATLIAQDWGPPSGIISLQYHTTLLAHHPVARMTILLVAPEARRRGLGRLLLKAGSQAARIAGCDRLECFVADDRPLLLAFLLATGFAQCGCRFVRSLRKKS